MRAIPCKQDLIPVVFFLLCLGSFFPSELAVGRPQYSPQDLNNAIQKNDVSLVETILASGVSPNWSRDYSYNFTPLAHACDDDRIDTLKVLLKWKANPNDTSTADENRRTPLHSCAYRSLEGTRILLEAGADPNRVGVQTKEAPLHQAAQALNPKIMKLLLKYGASPDAANQQRETPLHLLLTKYRSVPWGTDPTEFVETALQLIQKSKNLDAKDASGGTAFSYAVAEYVFRTAGVPLALIKAGAKDFTSHSGRGRPVDIALSLFDNVLLEFLLERKISPSADAIEDATRSTRFESYNESVTYELLLRRNLIKPNHVFTYPYSSYKGTLLYVAASVGNVSLLKLLLSLGVDITLGDIPEDPTHIKQTPLMAATKFGHSEAIKLLVQADPTKSKKQRYGQALHFAVLYAQASALRVLLENGVSPNLNMEDGEAANSCAFFAATRAKLWDHFRLFLDHRVNLNLSCSNDVIFRRSGIVELAITAGREYFDYLLVSDYSLKSEPRNIVDAAAGGIYYLAKCLTAGLDVNTVFDRQSPLSKAVWVGDLETIKFLLSKGANMNPDPKSQSTPLAMALQYQTEEVGLFLLDNGAQPAAVQTWGGELRRALENKYVRLAHEILNRSVKLEAGASSYLNLAVRTGDLALVERLIALKANVNDWALHTAAFLGHEQMVERLLAAGANKDAEVDYFGYGSFGTWYAPLSLAVMKGNLESVRVLLRYRADVKKGDPLWLAVERNFVDVAALLLAAGVNPNYWRWGTGMTPLLFSISKNQLPMVQLLTTYGANFEAEDATGCTALHYAASYCSPEIAVYLLAKNARKDLACRTRYPPHSTEGPANATPLYLATRCHDSSTLRGLIEAGANPQIDDLGVSPLMSFIQHFPETAAIGEVIATVRMLVVAGADVNFQGKDGLTALKVALAKKHRDADQLIAALQALGAKIE